MHDKSINDILGISRKFHDLIDHASITEKQAESISLVGAVALESLREILKPTPDQIAKLRDGLNAVVIAKLDAIAARQSKAH